ncbi:MAG: hypothetical protein HOQ32_07895 [Lysobacter sp.]|nr:hypothetical protein [Lysobacter sp.]
MRKVVILATIGLLIACSSEQDQLSATDPASAEFVGVAYYDRNNDGLADFELHMPGCDDCDWALIDDDFNGRYETHVLRGFSMLRTAIDSPVPKNVSLRAGQAPPFRWP